MNLNLQADDLLLDSYDVLISTGVYEGYIQDMNLQTYIMYS